MMLYPILALLLTVQDPVVPDGFKIEKAAESTFPMFAAFDDRGRRLQEVATRRLAAVGTILRRVHGPSYFLIHVIHGVPDVTYQESCSIC